MANHKTPSLIGRQLSQTEYLRLKARTRELIAQAGGQNICADRTRVSHTSLSRYGLPQHPADFMPLDIIADLEAECGEPIIARELAALTGHVLVLPQDGSTEYGDWSTHLSSLSRQSGELFAELVNALADGRIDAREAATLRGAAVELQAHITDVLQKLDQASGIHPRNLRSVKEG
jgi:hypothetical protein